MRLHLLRSSNDRARSPIRSSPRQKNNIAPRQRPSNALHRIITRCRLPCIRCSSDTVSLASELQYNSLLDTPMYLPDLPGAAWALEAQYAEDSDLDQTDDTKDEEEQDTDEEEEDTGLSLFSSIRDTQRGDNLISCNSNRNLDPDTEADETLYDMQPCTSTNHRNDGSTCARSRPSSLKRIHTNFIPLAFNSHRSWLERIDLVSISSTDDFSRLLSEDDDIEDEPFEQLDDEDDNAGGIVSTRTTELPDNHAFHNLHDNAEPDSVDNVNTTVTAGNSNVPASGFEWDSDTLPPFTLWRCNNSLVSCQNDNNNLLDLLSSSATPEQSTAFLDLVDNEEVQDMHGPNAVNAQILPDGNISPTENCLPFSTVFTSPNNRDFDLEPNSFGNDQPTEISTTEPIMSVDNMPESLRFLFQPLTGSSNSNSLPFSDQAEMPIPTTCQSEASLTGYDNVQGTVEQSQSSPSSQTSSLVNLQQNWYIYDPRLNPLNRQGRPNVHTALPMPAMVSPPDYEDLSSHNEETTEHTNQEPPPPYVEDELGVLPPPPTYDEALLDSLLTDVGRNQSQRQFAESSNVILPGNPSPFRQNLNFPGMFTFDHQHPADAIDNSEDCDPSEINEDEDDLDTNVILSTSNAQADTLITSSRITHSLQATDNMTELQIGEIGRAQSTPTQALQAGFRNPRGPAVAWNRPRWGENSNQSFFGLNSRLQSLNRF